ncbi:DUF746 domain-containing protein [Paraburkholderia heleia]|uniref:DUF746 domain-containing protein n=1 Tax=Paraburkholderia heleia TaxID=634127 RepID=UPI0038BD1F72
MEKWRDMFAAFADQIAPSGSLSSRIRLGAKPVATTPCPFCGRTGTARRSEIGNWVCGGCGRLFSMRRKVVERDGYLEIAGADPHNGDEV